MRCSRCGRVRLKGNWVACTDEKLAQEALKKCRGEYLRATYSFREQEGTFFVGDEKHVFPVKRKFKVNVVKNICPDCVRKSGGYFEAIIQLRGKAGKVRRYERLFKKMLAKKTFVTKEEELREGLDLYIGSSRAVVEMLAELGVRAKMSRKLAGQKEGRRLYRTTFLVRV